MLWGFPCPWRCGLAGRWSSCRSCCCCAGSCAPWPGCLLGCYGCCGISSRPEPEAVPAHLACRARSGLAAGFPRHGACRSAPSSGSQTPYGGAPMAVIVHTRYSEAIHPLHAVLLSGAFTLFLSALMSDIAYAKTFHIQWSNFASWLIVGGLLFASLALVFALV